MFQLLESIYLNEGVFRNLPYHEARMRRTLLDLFNKNTPIILDNYFKEIEVPSKGLYKARVIYDIKIRSVEFIPYTINSVKILKLINCDTISYEYKFLDRQALHDLYSLRDKADDVLIVKNGYITDTSYANIIFNKDQFWYTPTHCLLKGTMRESLLNAGVIREATIDSSNFLRFKSFKIINSMLGMDGEEQPIEFILR